MSEETTEIQVEQELLPAINKIAALAQLFDYAADRVNSDDKLDLAGALGVCGILESINSEIFDICYKLNDRIVGLESDPC